MNRDLFFELQRMLGRYIPTTPGRKILLHIHNRFARGNESTISVLNNVRVAFLPPNTTSKMQPSDDGIIAWVKRRYKCRLLLPVFENLEARVKIINKVRVLTVIRWTETEWNNFPSEAVRNCFKHCLKQNWQDVADLDSGEAEKETVLQTARDAEQHEVQVTKFILQCIFNPDGESRVTE